LERANVKLRGELLSFQGELANQKGSTSRMAELEATNV
jgi:hypothetical protein